MLRSYRAHKKEEVKKLLQENNELCEENQRLEIQNKALQAHLKNLEKEMMSLRSVMNKVSSYFCFLMEIWEDIKNMRGKWGKFDSESENPD